MAANNRKKVAHKINLSYDENEREERVKKAKVFPFAEIWAQFYDGEKGDEAKAIHDFKKYINEEVQAIDYAHYPEDGQRKEAYENTTPPKVKKPNAKAPAKAPRNKTNPLASEFFEAEDEFMQKHASVYEEYLMELTSAEGILDEKERAIRLNELRAKYQGAIGAFEECQKKYGKFEKYEQTMKFLNEVPEEVLANMVEFQVKCEERGKADLAEKVFEDMYSQPEYKSIGQNSENEEIKNEHRFRIGQDNDVVTHSIRNLNGSGLDLTFTDGEYSIVFCDDNMTKDQVEALADYCYRYGINIKDFGNLKGSKVVDNDNKEVGELDKTFQEAMENAEKSVVEVDKIVPHDDTIREEAVNPNESYFGSFIPKGKPLKSFNSQKAVDAAQKLTAGGGVVEPSYGWNTTTIRMYANEDDKEKDCVVDKNGKLQHTKKYAITINHSTGEALFYLGSKTQLGTGDVRVALATLKAQGYKYFEYPSIVSKKGFGAGTQKSMFEASVKEGMPLLLRGPSGRGCDIGNLDLTNDKNDGIIDMAMKEYQEKPAEKIEYFMRWHEQLEKYTKTTGKQSEFAASMDKLKDQVNFTYFQKTYKGSIEGLISEGIKGNNGEKWNDVDIICAIHAYDKVIKDIQEGKLANKRYNPMDEAGNNELIKKEFEKYRKDVRETVENEIEVALQGIEQDNTERGTTDKAINLVKSKYLGSESEGLGKTLKFLKVNGVDIGIDFRNMRVQPYKPKNRRTANNTNSSQQAHNVAKTPAFQKYVDGTGRP